MRKSSLLVPVSLLTLAAVYARSVDHVDGGHFLKRIEYNGVARDIAGGIVRYNIDSKSEVERLFFGDMNAPVEFFYEPSFEGASGFRIVKGPEDGSYRLDVKWVSNYAEAAKELEEKYPSIGIPMEWIDKLPKDILDLVSKHDVAMSQKYIEELPKHYKADSRSFPISSKFVKKLHGKVMAAIDDFRAEGVPPFSGDGCSVVFRCVVGDEVWSLRIHEPRGAMRELADLCLKIMDDARAGRLDESECIKLLNK